MVLDVFIRELVAIVSELSSAANHLNRVVVQALQAVDVYDLNVEGYVVPSRKICGCVPSVYTRCVGAVFPGKVRRRDHLYHRLKDLLSLQHVPEVFNLGIPHRQERAYHCKAAALENIARQIFLGSGDWLGCHPDGEQR